MKRLGYGEGYHYVHDDYDVQQQNLPDALRDRAYFDPSGQGDETRLRAWIDARRGTAPKSNADDPFADA
jgi:putative ATPase